MKRFLSVLVTLITLTACLSPAWGVVVLNDPLQGSTIGTRENGAFVTGGWQVTAQYDTIYWHIGTYNKGSFQFNLKGITPGQCTGPFNSINEYSHMYDYTIGNSDIAYNGGYRDNTYKQFLRRSCYSPKIDTMEILWQILPNFLEDDTSVLSWNVNNNYLFRNEWENVGGNSICKTFRDGILIITQTLPGSWSPAGQSVRIAASPRRADEGAHVGSIYSNVQAEDLTNAVPGAPSITLPTSGETVNTTVVYVQWSGDSHNSYQLRVCTQNNPDAGIVYDSQQTASNVFYAWSGTLFSGSTYYAFVRLGAGAGYGAWSAGRNFTVNTSFVPPGPDIVQLKGNSVVKNSGPFNGLGFTYMQALRRCKYDRARFTSDLSFMASKEFKYMRALSMVGWYSAWQGKEIAPIGFIARDGYFVPAWPDYWQQFRDMIDIAYDTYGIRTELTIFADAQLMPNKPDRIAHMQTVLDNLVGREHKIMHLEVCNEAWQNGFPDAQGVADLREFCQYLTDRTNLLVAISDSQGEGAVTVELYSGSTADICTEHFSRDIGTIEGGWLPVRDPWHLEDLSGVPVGSNNEPIGPGSSVAQETDPIKLVMCAAHTWGVNLPLYVFHSEAGVFGNNTFESAAGIGDYIHLDTIMPPDIASWVRNDGKETVSPFTNFSMGQANKWWPEVAGSTNGCDRNYGKIKGPEFMTFPIGILGGGLTIEARRPMNFQAYNPLTGAVAYNLTLSAGQQTTLAQGPAAYIIKGFFTDVPGGGGGGGAQVSIDLGTTNVESGMTHPQVGDGDTVAANIGARDCRKTVNGADNYMYFAVSDGYAFQGSKPNQWINVDYYDTGTGTAQLQYDATDGNFYKAGPSVTYTNTNTWKRVVWNVTDAYFGNRQNDGSDFRIFRDPVFYLDIVTVYQKAFSGTPVSIPGTVEAENYDNGGEDNAYNDTDVGNNGGQYRLNENVDVEATTDTGGGFNVGWTAPTEYLNYQVNVVTAGNYDFSVRAASGGAGGTFHIEINAVNVTGTQTIPGTGGWQTWTTVNIPNITLSTGVKTMKFVVDSGGYNLNYIAINGHQGPFGGTNRTIPGLIQAEDFDDGGPGTAYNDVTPTNDGGQYRTGEQVDIEATTDTGGGYNVGWTEPGEWLEYTVNVNTTGDYAIKVRAASGGSGGSFHFSMDGTNFTSTKSLAGTGGWQSWTTIIVPGIFLSAGNNKVLRLSIDAGGWNINHMDFTFGGADVVSYDLDTTGISDGMDHPQVADGDTTGASIGGHNCRQNVDPGAGSDFYMYFSVADIYAFQGSKNNAAITLEYYDNGTGAFELHYDGTSNPYAFGGSVARTNTNTWKTTTYNVTDAYFGNRQNAGADFRFYGGATTFYFDTVMVFSSTGVSPPGQASAPNPANGATLVNKNADLSWTAGSGATNRDVRFGTANPPPFVINQTATTYDPGTMTPNTTYFWRIDEKNTGGTTNGVVWSFTTLPLPGAASAPNPANGATLVPITTDPSWTAGSNAASHDVRFGTANPPPFVVNQTSTTYAAPTLSPNTVYFWRIDEVNTSGTTTGTVWSFTTLPLPGAASAPNPANGATGVATNAQLSWTAGSNAASHDVRYGTANPPPFVVNQTGTTYNPGTLANSTTYYWRIDEVNSSGTTTGTVWSFTTVGSVPTYLTNSSFEAAFVPAGGSYVGSVGTGWTPFLYTGIQSNLSFADETGAGNTDSGTHSQKITAAAVKEGGVYNQFSVTSGQNYTVTVRVKSGSPAGWCFLGIHPSGGTDPLGAGMIWPMDNGRSTSWQTLSWTGQATGNLITVFLDTYDGATYWDTATPGPVTINNSAFPSNADGWNIVVWKSGAYDPGTMVWAGTNGNPTGNMLAGASGATNNTDSCNREGGEINKLISTAGYNTIQVQYDLRFETDQTGPTCIGGCTAALVEGTCSDKIGVYYSTAGTGGPWTLLEVVNASSVAQNVWSTRTINCPAGANNQANFAVRLRFQFNKANTDKGRLDNVKVIGTP